MSDKINSVSYYDMAQNEKSTKARTDMYQKGAEVGDVKCMHGMCKEASPINATDNSEWID